MNSSKSRNEIIGERIREGRVLKGLTQEELGELVHMSRKSISAIENGRRIVDAGTLGDICEELGLSQDWVTGGSDNKNVIVVDSTIFCMYMMVNKFTKDERRCILDGMRIFSR